MVDVLLEALPRRVVQVLLFALALAVVLFDWTEPIMWYIQDKADGITELYMEWVASSTLPAS